MCGRFAAGNFTQAQMAKIVRDVIGEPVSINTQTADHKMGYHIRPTDQVMVIDTADSAFEISSARWQINRTDSPAPIINAKIENNRFWANAWAHNRCIIPALGYFEWTKESGRKQPNYISINSNAEVNFFAGFTGISGGNNRHDQSVAIITRPALSQIDHIHHRMPVVLSQTEIIDWLRYEIDIELAQQTLGTRWDGQFNFHNVAPLTNASDSAQVIKEYFPPQRSFDF